MSNINGTEIARGVTEHEQSVGKGGNIDISHTVLDNPRHLTTMLFISKILHLLVSTDHIQTVVIRRNPQPTVRVLEDVTQIFATRGSNPGNIRSTFLDSESTTTRGAHQYVTLTGIGNTSYKSRRVSNALDKQWNIIEMGSIEVKALQALTRSDKDTAVLGKPYTIDVVTLQSTAVTPVKYSHMMRVVTVQTILSSNPHKTLGILYDIIDQTAR